MATPKKAPLMKAGGRQSYTVLVPYQCPNRKHWHQVGEEVELLACEADFLLLSNKISQPISNQTPNNIVASSVKKNTQLVKNGKEKINASD